MQTRAYSFSEDISYMYCKDIGQFPYKRMSIVQDTIQLQANTVQHLHYSGEMVATMEVLAFKRQYFTWWLILRVCRHLDLLSDVAPTLRNTTRVFKNVAKVINLEAVKF